MNSITQNKGRHISRIIIDLQKNILSYINDVFSSTNTIDIDRNEENHL